MGVGSARVVGRLAALALLFQSGAAALWRTAQPQTAPIDAHPLRIQVTTIVEFGEQYLGSELYNAKITVLEVVRGEKARGIVRLASASNPAPKQGFEYVLARVRFEFSARTSLANHSYGLDPNQFTATGPDGREFSTPSLAIMPAPSLKGTLKSGDSLEGWLAFLVPQNTSKPLMVFHEDVGDVSHVGGGTWFELYERPARQRSPSEPKVRRATI